jgi:Tol biopolymer transport system component
MDRWTVKILFFLLFTFCCLTGICQDDQLRIVKTAKSENPKLYIASFDGTKDVFNNLQDAIYYSDWFEIVTTSNADFLLSVSYGEGSNARFISINLVDSNQNSVTQFQKKTTFDTDVTSLIYDSVDEMIRRVFNRPGICSSKLAFVKKLNGSKEIWISEFNGANPKQFTHNNTISVEPSWSPENRYLAYTLYEAHSMKVVLVDLARGLQRRLTNFPGLNSGTQFSNDSRFAAVTLSK